MAQMVAEQGEAPESIRDAPLSEYTKTIVIKSHTATDDSQLSLQVNEIVYVLEQDATGWWGGHKEGDDFTGWVPGSCVMPLGVEHGGAVVPEALETEMRSPLRQSQLVASPQRREHRRSARSDLSGVQQGTAVSGNVSSFGAQASLAAENARLKNQNNELSNSLTLARQQIEAQQQSCTEMEAAMKQACTRQEQAEQKLQEERTRLCGEAAILREQIEEERRKSEGQYKMIEDMQEEVRKASEQTQTEKQRAQWLENRLQGCQEEMEALRLCQHQAAVVSAVGPPVTFDAASLQVTTPNAGETRRRLFPSMADATQVQTALTNTNDSTASVAESSSNERWTPTSATLETSRGRALTATSRGPPSSQAPPPIAGIMSRCTSTRPPEPPRSASSAPRSGRSAAPTGRLGHAHSTGDLAPHRSASCDGSLANLSKSEEAPPPGCVADKVTIFEQRCRTPIRSYSSRNIEIPERRNCRTSRDDAHTRATPPALPRVTPAVAPRSPQDVAAQLAQLGPLCSHGSGAAPSERGGRRLPRSLEMPLDDDEQDGPGEHVVFGMSPMGGCRLLEPPSSSNLMQVGTVSM